MKKWIFFFLSFLAALLALPQDLLAQPVMARPSAHSCTYYQSLESEMKCGPDAYLANWGGPMCAKYLKHETNFWKSLLLTSELKAWFPRVRLCLQQDLEASKSQLTCDNLTDFAKDSHIRCYVQTGFCELSSISKLQLGKLSAAAVISDDTGIWD